MAPVVLLRLEGAALAAAAIAGYFAIDGSWLLFAVLILAPDLSMAGYAAGPRVGAAAYNACHVTVAPIALLMAGYVAAWPLAVTIGLVWLAHIGVDRALGYGLKLPSDFRDTHLGRISRG